MAQQTTGHHFYRARSAARTAMMALTLGAGFVTGTGCGGTSDPTSDQNVAAAKSNLPTLQSCHLLDGSVDPKDKPGVCDPGDTHKTTICHIPPGNPSNAHTLCVGNPAVPAHLRNHGDYLGQCKIEQPCPPPTGGSTGTGGSGINTGTGGSGASGTTGTGGAGTGGAAGAGGMSYLIG